MMSGLRLAACCLLTMCILGCTTGCRAVKSVTSAAGGSTNPTITSEDLRARLTSFSTTFALSVEQAADRIVEQSDFDSAIRRHALLWKLQFIPLCRKTVFEPEVRTAFLGVWMTCVQMLDYFEDGEGKEQFGDLQSIAVTTSRELEDGISKIGALFIPAKRLEEVRSNLLLYSREHPMIGDLGTGAGWMTNTLDDLQGSLQWVFQIPMSPFRALEGVDEGAQAIRVAARTAERFAGVIDELPEYLRWEIELILLDIDRNETVVGLVSGVDEVARGFESVAESVAAVSTSFESVAESAAALTQTAETLPADIRKEVVTAIEAAAPQLAEIQTTLKEAQTTIDGVNQALDGAEEMTASIESTMANFAEAGKVWDQTLQTFDETYSLLVGETATGSDGTAANAAAASAGAGSEDGSSPAAGGRSEGNDDDPAPFDINDYTEATKSAATMAVEVRALLTQFNQLATDDQVTEHFSTATEATLQQTEKLIDHLTWRVIQAIVVLLVAALAYRFLSARFVNK